MRRCCGKLICKIKRILTLERGAPLDPPMGRFFSHYHCELFLSFYHYKFSMKFSDRKTLCFIIIVSGKKIHFILLYFYLFFYFYFLPSAFFLFLLLFFFIFPVCYCRHNGPVLFDTRWRACVVSENSRISPSIAQGMC